MWGEHNHRPARFVLICIIARNRPPTESPPAARPPDPIGTSSMEPAMAHKQILFRSTAREKILRGATQLADAIRVTLGPKSKSVLIQKKWGAPLVCNDGVDHRQGNRSQGSGGEPRRAGAAPGGREDRRSGRRRHQHGDHPGARDLRRRRAQRGGGRQRGRPQARSRPRPQGGRRGAARDVAAGEDAQGKGAGRDHFGAQRRVGRRSWSPRRWRKSAATA